MASAVFPSFLSTFTVPFIFCLTSGHYITDGSFRSDQDQQTMQAEELFRLYVFCPDIQENDSGEDQDDSDSGNGSQRL